MASTEPLTNTDKETTVGAGSQTLMRGLDVIEAIAQEVLGLPELADRLALTKSTTHRLASALVEQGDTARGLPLLQKASSQAPNSMEIRYHLAQALHKSGDKAGARRELDKLLAPGTQFAHADEARALLKSL